MSLQSKAPALVLLGAASLQACITTNLAETCSGIELANVETTSLGVVLGAPASRLSNSPFVLISTPSQAAPTAALQLNLTPGPIAWPTNLDETPCQGLDWRTFRVTVDPEQWAKFWNLPRPMPTETAIGFLDSTAPLRSTQFAFALVNTSTAETLMSCGCYRT